MAEAIWYYAVDDHEHGPITSAQLKALAASGGLKPDDLVWREGLEDWKPAREVSGLFTPSGVPTAARSADAAAASPAATASPPAVAETPAPESAVAAAKTGRPAAPLSAGGAVLRPPATPQLAREAVRPSALTSVSQPLQFGHHVGQPLLLVGLVLVLLAKGCDSVGNRYLQQIQARIELRQNEFEDEWGAKRKKIEDQIADLRDRGELDTDARANLTGLTEEINVINDQMREKREELEAGAWQALRKQARDSSSDNKVWAYYREMVFVFGTILLTVGLLAVGFTGEGAQKWICLIMLAIVTFSLYVGGTAWIGALTEFTR